MVVEWAPVVPQASEWSVNTLRQMALMDMGEILTLEGVILLKDQLQRFLVEAPPWSEARLHRISELATNLGVAKLVQQAEQTLARYTEVQAMLSKRQETLQRAEDRLKVSRTPHPCGDPPGVIQGEGREFRRLKVSRTPHPWGDPGREGGEFRRLKVSRTPQPWGDPPGVIQGEREGSFAGSR